MRWTHTCPFCFSEVSIEVKFAIASEVARVARSEVLPTAKYGMILYNKPHSFFSVKKKGYIFKFRILLLGKTSLVWNTNFTIDGRPLVAPTNNFTFAESKNFTFFRFLRYAWNLKKKRLTPLLCR